MISKKVILVFMIAVAIWLFNVIYTIWNYNTMPETIAIHLNLAGEPDGFGNKVYNIYALIFNFCFLLFIFFFIKNPQYANYPSKITEENKATLQLKMQYFLSFTAIFISFIMVGFTFKIYEITSIITNIYLAIGIPAFLIAMLLSSK